MSTRTKTFLSAFLLLGLATLSSAMAQVTRVVVFPFDADATSQAYQLGLASALQRSLNQIPGVFSPPVGDTALVANRAVAVGADVDQTVGRLFDASALVTGQVSLAGGGVRAVVNVDIAGGTQTIDVSGADPAAVAVGVALGVADIIAPTLSSAARAAVEATASDTPSLPSLAQAGLSASGLPGASVADLDAATQLDPDSAWARSEHAKALALAGSVQAAVDTAIAAGAMAPGDAEVQATIGVVLSSAGRVDEATAAFAASLAVNPAHAIALAGRASISGDAAARSTDLQAAVDAYPRFVDAHIRLAAQQADPVRSLQTLRRAESYAPDSLLLRSTVMELLLELGDTSSALAYLQQSLTDPLARSAGLYALARGLPASMATQALAIIEAGQATYPDSTELVVARADVLLQAGRPDEALTLLQPIYDANPGNASVGNLLAVTKARMGDIDGARVIFEAQRGQGASVDRALAELYVAAGRAGAALELLEPLAAEAPDDAQLQALLGTALVRTGRLDEGQAALENALAIEPDHALARRSLSLLEQQRELTRGDQIAFSEEAGAAFQQGLYALDVSDYTAAAAAFARSRAIEENALTAFYHGYARQLAGDTDGAVDDYLLALDTFGESDIVLNNLGYAYLELGRYDLAGDYLNRAAAANPANAQVHLNLGLYHFALQRYPQAITAFEEAIRLDPSLQTAASSLIEASRERAGQ